MKLRKQIKNRVVAVLMLASLALCFLSYFDLYSVQASSFYSYDRYSGEPDKDGNVSHSVTQVQSTSDIAPTYLMLYHPYEEGKNSFIYVLLAIGKGGFKAPKCSSVGDDGSVSNYDAQYVGSAGSGLDNYNCYVIEAQFGGYLKYKSAGYCINVNINHLLYINYTKKGNILLCHLLNTLIIYITKHSNSIKTICMIIIFNF